MEPCHCCREMGGSASLLSCQNSCRREKVVFLSSVMTVLSVECGSKVRCMSANCCKGGVDVSSKAEQKLVLNALMYVVG